MLLTIPQGPCLADHQSCGTRGNDQTPPWCGHAKRGRDGRYVWRMVIPGEWSSYGHMQVICRSYAGYKKNSGNIQMIFWVKKVFYVAVAWLPSETAIRTDTWLEVFQPAVENKPCRFGLNQPKSEGYPSVNQPFNTIQHH